MEDPDVTDRPQTKYIGITRCDDNGVAISVDIREIYDGDEQLVERKRIICEEPANALKCLAIALYPNQTFEITEVKSNDRAH